MDARSNAAPVIIKRKKIVISGGHHGGAWKVAYADFVTAMMAFFLLMWLLGATTENQRKGIADYFTPTIPVHRVSGGGGSGAFGGDTILSEKTLAQSGTGASDVHSTESRQARGELGVERSDMMAESRDAAAFAQIEEQLKGRSGESLASDDVLRHIVTRVTDEGLIVEISDRPGAPLFDPDSNEPTPVLRAITDLVASVAAMVENEIAIGAHTHARPVTVATNPVWELTAARADRTRTLLGEAGLSQQRMRRVTGHADRSPRLTDPMDVANNRLEVILLRSP